MIGDDISKEDFVHVDNLLIDINNGNINSVSCPKCIEKALEQWINAITTMEMNITCLPEYFSSSFCLFNNNMVYCYRMNQIFKKVEEIWCYLVGEVDDLHLDKILSHIKQMNFVKYSLLRRIELDYININ